MKINKLFAAFMLFAAVAITACGPDTPQGPTGPTGGGGEKDTTTHKTAAYDTITVAQAIEIANGLEASKTSATCYICIGTVDKVLTTADKVAEYGNINFNLKDETGTIGCYYTYYKDSVKFTSAENLPKVGTRVVIAGKIKNYVNSSTSATTPEFVNAYFVEIEEEQGKAAELENDGSESKPFTATDVITLANAKTGSYFVKAYIVGQIAGKSISSGAEFKGPFTTSTDTTSFGTNLLVAASDTVSDYSKCVPVALPSGAVRNGLNLPENPNNLGKEVILYGSLEAYFGQPGIKATSYAKIGDKEYGKNPNYQATTTEVSIAEARAIASALEAGGKTNDNYRVKDVIVAAIYTSDANVTKYGNINLLVKDAKGDSIACYYTNNIGNVKFTAASQLPKVGATVTVEGPLKNYKKDQSTTPEFENAWFVAISETKGN